MHTSTYKFFSSLLILAILSFPFTVPQNAEAASASSAIAGRCASKVGLQQVTANLVRLAISAVGWTGQTTDTALGVPTMSGGQGFSSIWQSGEGGASAATDYLKPLTDCVIHEVSQQAVDMLNQQVVGAIKNGLRGVSNYNPNINNLVLNLSGMVAGELQNQINGLALCNFDGANTFKNTLSNSVGLSTRQNSRPKFASKVECPFKDALGNDTSQAYYNGNFTWNSMETSLTDNGNPFGLAVQAGQELAVRTQETQKLQDQQTAIGSGFSPVVDTSNCNYPDGLEAFLLSEADDATLANAQRLYCKATTPGKTLADQLSDVVNSDSLRLQTSDTVTKIMDGFITQQTNDAISGIF